MRLSLSISIFVLSLCILAGGARAEEAGLHDLWQEVLQTHVDEQGRVSYKALAAEPDTLNRYLKVLATTQPDSLIQNGKLAYWINAYNAFTVKLILDHYPLKSIRDIKKPWDQKVWKAGGRLYSLNDIEHKILRKDFTEPRIHFAIVCASIGCPDLWNQAYRESSVGEELDAAAKRFLGSPKHLEVDFQTTLIGGQGAVLKMSKIFKWFKKDFTAGGKHSLQSFVLPYVDKASQVAIRSAGEDIKIKYLGYDWNLNDRP
jgi:hypothetical protein